MTILDEVGASIKQLAEGAGASVVGIGQRWGVGSGIVLGEGRVLTNAHNVRGDKVTVTFADGRTVEGTVAGHDIDSDLAVINVDTGGAPALPWASDGSAEIGKPVFALSNPGGRGLRVTFGFVSGIERTFRGPRGRRITGSLEHTAPLLPGSSGGPVLDAAGQLLGINTNRLGEGFYLAIPADEALRGRADALAQGETATPPRLGISSPPAMWPGACAAPSASPKPTACSFTRSSRAARPPAPASPAATWSWRPRADQRLHPMTCSTRSRPYRVMPSNSPSCAAPTSGPCRSPSPSQTTTHNRRSARLRL